MGRLGHLLGRDVEQRRVLDVLGLARNGRGGAVVITGEPGIGKTTVLEATTGDPTGMQLLRVDGYEAESTIPFAAVHRLTIPLHDHLDGLPERHREALLVASGARGGFPPDRFLVGLGVLGMLAAAGERRPLVCAVDDAHFLDPESLDVLAFVARRLEAESVAVALVGRNTQGLLARTAGVPTLLLAGLETEAAVRLLDANLPEPMDPAAAALIAAATGGNPLALVDLANEFSVKQLTESSIAAEPIPIGTHLEAFYVRRVRQLAADTQTWLLVAAADSTGNVDLITTACEALGLPDGASDEAEDAGLIELGRDVRFRHPLVRSAAYNAARGGQRRGAHARLAAAADALGLVELEAWHAAKATLGTDEGVAARLERVADLAGSRGGFTSSASVLAQSSALTPEGSLKYGRLVAAAEAALAAGAGQLAKSLLDDIDEDAVDDISRGRMIAVRATLALFLADPAVMEAGAQMLAAAECFHGADAEREQHALIKAFEYTLPAERLARGATLPELGSRMSKGAEAKGGLSATVLRGLAAHVLLPYADAVPAMREAVAAIADLQPEEMLLYGPASVALTTGLWDATTRHDCLRRTADAARDAGSLQLLDTTLWIMSLAELSGGTPRRATEYIDQVRELRRAIGYDAEHVINVALLAWGDTPVPQVEAIAEGAGALGFGGVQASGVAALAVRDLAEGHYDAAYQRLKPQVEDPFLQVTPLTLPDFVEAACRSDRAGEAKPHVASLHRMADANGSPWNRGVALRGQALLADDDAAEGAFRGSLDLLEAAGTELDLARSHLVYGEWLRRNRRRRDARTHLRAALTSFEANRAPWFARRADAELQAMGEHAPSSGPPAGVADLTAQELTVARLAAEGSTNAEIGASMFLSPNTVDYHLRKIFQKLGISSRRQLSDRLG
ncbi:helix-turn-helix transcriptional regulator [Nocardioides taihuensis]|uniref:AAA family ATPase n=1 Tax=Nocardioides taihuensis TaxID=1835606 RepID=A0ABW0BK74_9ACTN